MRKNLFLAYIRDLLTNPSMYFSIIIVAGLLIFSCNWEISIANWNSGIALFINHGFIKMVCYIVACFPLIGSFCDEYKNQYIRSIVTRLCIKKYTFSKYWACFISAFLVLFIGIFLGMTVMGIVNGVPIKHPTEDSGSIISFVELEQTGIPILMFIVRLLIYSLFGAFYACIGLTISVLIPNKFLTFTVPFVISFVLEEIGWYVKDLMPRCFNLFHLDAGEKIFLEQNVIINIVYSVAFSIFISYLVYIIFNKLVEKRVSCELN